MQIKKIKKFSRNRIRKNYALLTFTCLVSVLLGVEFYGSLAFIRIPNIPNISYGTRGVFARIIYMFTSGTITNELSKMLYYITGSEEINRKIFIVLGFIFSLLVYFLIKSVYQVVSKRIFLETRIYDKVPINKFIYLIKIKKWFYASFVMFIYKIYYFIWCFTIYGIFTKRYSLYLVPYILSENPNIKPREIINLSENMMYNHKLECFKLELSFIGYQLLGIITLGISNIFYTNSYFAATQAEYYSYIRKEYIKNKGHNYELLNDKYLFKKANKLIIATNYKDIFNLKKKKTYQNNNSIKYKILNYFGINLFSDKEKEIYDLERNNEYKINQYKDVISTKVYPSRLFPIKVSEKKNNNNYLKSYKLLHLILMFFIFSFIGFSWEVFLHLIEEGIFVKRGVLQGPWLPIYGYGGTLILVILYKFRHKPYQEFLLIILLCGLIEYFTALYLEITYGISWWNYNGYFLNLHGRICAEGLLVFAIGGMSCVYFIAPLLDNLFSKINVKYIKIITIILVILFIIDKTYTYNHPNTGEGITENLIKEGGY